MGLLRAASYIVDPINVAGTRKKGDDIGTAIDKKFISGDWSARSGERKAEKEAVQRGEAVSREEIGKQEAGVRDWGAQEESRLGQLSQADKDYLSGRTKTVQDYTRSTTAAESQFQEKLREAEDISRGNLTNARETYKTLSPMHRDVMNTAKTEADSAMSLRDYMDPNNRVQSAYRDLYNKEGASMRGRYETQAQNEQRQGVADYGVLSSLGAQAAANQSVGPMTVGQQMANMAVANRQAGEAFANTQRRMQLLRDYGMQGEDALRGQGLAAGERASDKAYEAGRLSREDLSRRMADFEGFEDRNIGRTTGISDRLVNLGGQTLGSQGRVRDTRAGGEREIQDLSRANTYGDVGRRGSLSRTMLEDISALSDKRMGRSDVGLQRELGTIANQRADRERDEAIRKGMFAGAINVAGTAAGGMMGGPQGAATGGGIAQSFTSPMMQGGGAAPQPAYFTGGYTPTQQSAPTVAPQPMPQQPMPPYTSGYAPGYNYGGGYTYPARPSLMQ
jgi:hypothetical protein